MQRIAQFMLVCLLLVTGLARGEGIVELAEDLRVHRVAPRTWLHVSYLARENGSAVAANGLVIEQENILVIIDTPWTLQQTAALLDWVTARFEKPVAYVIATHGHRDQVGGAALLASRKIPLFMHHTALDFLDAPNFSPGLVRELELRAGGNFILGGLEILFPGHGHAPGNLVVYLPAQRVLFAGCLLRSAGSTSLGYIEDASVAGWQYAVNQLPGRFPKTEIVVPGHGEPGDTSLIAHTLALLRGAGPGERDQ